MARMYQKRIDLVSIIMVYDSEAETAVQLINIAWYHDNNDLSEVG